MARLTERGLRRSVGVPGLFATAYGNVGSSIYYALGLVAAHALGLTPLVFVFAGGLFALTAKTYAEGAAMFPEAGGSSSFARHAFDDVVSFFAGWALSLDYILTIAISAFFVPHYLSAFPGLGALKHNPDDIFGGLIVVALLVWLNIRGLGESAKLNLVLAVLDLSTQILLAGVGIVLVLNPALLVHQVHLGSVPSWKELIFALSLAMLAYTGIETVANMAEESKDPGRQVPKAVNLVVLAVLAVYAGISVVALSALPVIHHGVGYSPELKQSFSAPGYATSLGGFFENDPMLGVIEHLGLHGTVLKLSRYYLGLLAATILFIATNAGMIGISRLSWSLAEHRQLPSIFSQLHAKYRTPWFTLIFFSGLASTLIIYGNTQVLGNLYSFGAMLSFTTAHAAIVKLRVSDPDRERPYRTPWSVRIRGAEIPMTAVIGGIGTASAWVAVTVLHVEARYRRCPLDDLRDGGLLLLPPPPGPGPAQALPDRTGRAPPGLPGARLPHRARADLRRGRQRRGAAQRREADRRGRRRLCDLRAARPQPALAGVGPGGRGGPGSLGARERAHPGAARGHQDPYRPDPHAQPRGGARRRSRTGRLGCDLLVGDPRPRRRAADRPHRRLPAQQAPLPDHHRDREPPCAIVSLIDRGARARLREFI